jgi:hypothetical protein
MVAFIERNTHTTKQHSATAKVSMKIFILDFQVANKKTKQN